MIIYAGAPVIEKNLPGVVTGRICVLSIPGVKEGVLLEAGFDTVKPSSLL